MGPRNGEDGGEGSGGVDTEGSAGTFWSLEIVESVVDDDGDGSSIGVGCGVVQEAECMGQSWYYVIMQQLTLSYRDIHIVTRPSSELKALPRRRLGG